MNNNIYDMHYGASVYIFKMAEKLRENMTDAESILWELLKNKNVFNLKFRRQHPINRYIADFYCHKIKLVIELDGKIHLKKEIHENDKERQLEIEEYGITVIRFTNDEVINSTETVLNKIELKCKELQSV